jgi:tRNA U38,U39,U40 pseudouridine synthase TruA
MSPTLIADPRVEASIRRLKAMGLEVEVHQESSNEVLIKITGRSILNYLVRKLMKAITYPNKDVWFDFERDAMFIYMWRGKPRKAVTAVEEEVAEEGEEDGRE